MPVPKQQDSCFEHPKGVPVGLSATDGANQQSWHQSFNINRSGLK